MSELDGPAKLKRWMAQNRTGLISRPGNRGNQVTAYLYNIINNNNINVISSTNPASETVTQAPFGGVTRVTGGSEPPGPRLPELPKEKALGNQSNPAISSGLPQIPRLPASAGEGEVDLERTFLSEFLSWMDAEAVMWPRETRVVMLHIQEWFRGQGYRDPADLILAFVTVQELMRRKGGPVVLAPEAASFEKLAREVFGEDVVVYWAPGALPE